MNRNITENMKVSIPRIKTKEDLKLIINLRCGNEEKNEMGKVYENHLMSSIQMLEKENK